VPAVAGKVRFDYGSSNPPADKTIAGNQIEDVGNNFTVTVPAYTSDRSSHTEGELGHLGELW